MQIGLINKTTMKTVKSRITKIVIINAVNLIFGCSGQKYIADKWQTGDFKQQTDTMLLQSYNYNADNKVFYYISNDDKNIYLSLKLLDKTSQIKILRFGLTVWIDPKAKNNKNLGIKFPIENNDPHFAFGKKATLDDKKLQLSQQSVELELIGFNGEDSQIISSSDTNNVHGKLDLAKDTSLVYKLIIPVKCITSVTPFKDDDLLSIGFESGFLEPPKSDRSNEGFGMNGRGGFGGNMGGGRFGGGTGGGSGSMGGQGGYGGGGHSRSGNYNPEKMQQRKAEREELSKPIKFWIEKIMLAKQIQ